MRVQNYQEKTYYPNFTITFYPLKKKRKFILTMARKLLSKIYHISHLKYKNLRFSYSYKIQLNKLKKKNTNRTEQNEYISAKLPFSSFSQTSFTRLFYKENILQILFIRLTRIKQRNILLKSRKDILKQRFILPKSRKDFAKQRIVLRG